MLPCQKINLIILIALSAKPSPTQKINFKDGYPNNINPVGIVKNIPSSTFACDCTTVKTFRFLLHGAHSFSGLALERSNTVFAKYYWQ